MYYYLDISGTVWDLLGKNFMDKKYSDCSAFYKGTIQHCVKIYNFLNLLYLEHGGKFSSADIVALKNALHNDF